MIDIWIFEYKKYTDDRNPENAFRIGINKRRLETISACIRNASPITINASS